MKCLYSIHDVMPETLPQVAGILELLAAHRIRQVGLLVVPGKPWDSRGLSQLRRWESEGHELVGHGWHHHCPHIRTWYHRLHSWLLSRDVAEHLSLSPVERIELMRRCRAWFLEHRFQAPQLYVPPAWALGRLPQDPQLQAPFERIETLTGFLEVETGCMKRLPLVGFEADTRFRQWSLRLLNGLNRWYARWSGLPLRVSLHPNDLQLLLAKDIERLVSEGQAVSWEPQPVPACEGASCRETTSREELLSAASRTSDSPARRG